MQRDVDKLEAAVAALKAQRALLGDELLDVALAPLLAQLSSQRAVMDAQQLRQVSVLFLDVVGSTGWGDRLDPEDLQAVIDGALAVFTAAVERQGGKVLQYAGDSLLAVFGAVDAREDHAERGVQAGLDLLQAARAQAAQIQARHGPHGFGVRVGISSGGVLLGGGVDADRSIRGSTVNIAARMEQTAPPGALRICQDTWRLVRGRFQMREQPPLQVKGRDEPMRTWLVDDTALPSEQGAHRGVDGVPAPMLGRDRQWQALQQAFEALCSDAAPTGLQWLTVVGEAGMGKSRLLQEFSAWLATRPVGVCRLQAQGAERRTGEPYGVLRELFIEPLGLRRHDGGAPACQAWLDAVAPRLGRPADAAVLGQLLGLDFADEPEVRTLSGDARLLRDRAFFHAAHLLQHWAPPGARLVLLLDDLHWADDGSLDFIEYLAQTGRQLPAMLVALGRPELLERRPRWADRAHGQWCIDLPPLAQEVCDSLLHTLLQRLPDVPDALASQLLQLADGNPFFIEELINMLIDQGAILAQGSQWQLRADRLADLRVPVTLADVLQARIDALPADEHEALQSAAVVGPVFWDDALATLYPPGTGAPTAALERLARRGLIHRRAHSSLDRQAEYAFRHHTLHRVCYDSVLKRVKRPAHAALARWLANQPGPPLHDQIAEHHERGGELALARDAWQRAAEAARSRFANAQALAHADRALALTDAHALAQRLQLTLLRMMVFNATADRQRAADCLAQLQALAEQQGDDGWRSEAAARQARQHFDGGDAAQALVFAQRAAALAPRADKLRGARAEWMAMIALNRLGRHDEARQAARQALRLAHEADARSLAANVHNDLGSMAFDVGDVGEAIAHYAEALAIHRSDGHLSNQGGTLCNLAFIALSVGDFGTAHAQLVQARALCEQVGQRQNTGIIDINLGLVLLQLGRADEAQVHASRALELLRATGDRWAEAAALRVVGQCALALGQPAAARQDFVASRDLFDALDMPHLALEALAALIDEALARGDVAAALDHAEDILARRARGVGLEGTDEPLRIPLATWQALHAAGDERAPAALAEAERELRARAARITDPQHRQGYLQAVPCHCAILAAAARYGV